MNIFITGGSGFIGRNLLEHLSKQYKVRAPSHQELELLDEAAVADYLSRYKFDVVIHAAVRPGHRNAKDPANQLYNNTRMFFNIARNAKKFAKLIFLSSGLVYDSRYYLPKMGEGYFDTHLPCDEAGLSKYIAAKYIEKSRNILELRLFGLFGKYEDYSIRFISNAICKAIFGLALTIKQNRRFDYLYINDLMPVIDYFIEKEAGFQCYNVTPDETIELLTLAEKIRAVSGKELAIKIAQEGMGTEYSGDNSRLRKEIKELKFTPIDAAIKELYAWYAQNKFLIDQNLLGIDK